jgi:hypothetical protein
MPPTALESTGTSFTPATAARSYVSVLTTRFISLSLLTIKLGHFGRQNGQNRYEDEKMVRTDRKLTESRADARTDENAPPSRRFNARGIRLALPRDRARPSALATGPALGDVILPTGAPGRTG